MGAKTRREFTDAFKREAVMLWEASGRLQTDVARELGIQPSVLRQWQRRGHGTHVSMSAAKPLSTVMGAIASSADQAAEVARLKRELERARMERDILKKAVGICAEAPR